MNFTRRLLSVAIACSAAMALPVAAQSWPSKPIRIVVGFGPGSGADTIARILAERLAEGLKTSVVVENREGAASAIGTMAVARAPADGYTLLLAASTMTVNPYVQSSNSYDPVKDFVPIVKVAEIPLLMITSPNAPYNNLKELVAYAKQNPGKLSYATSGNGSPSHLSVELIRQATGITVVAVPYKNVGQAMTDALSGTVSFYFPGISAALPQVKSGKAKGLVVGAPKRSAKAPEIPTINEEIGTKGLEVITWYGLLAPAGTPKDVVARIHAETQKVMANKETQDKITATGLDLAVANTEEFAAEVRADSAKYEKLVKSLGLKE